MSADSTILGLTVVTPKGALVIPVADPTAASGLQNVSITVAALLAQLQAAMAGSQIYTITGAPSPLLGNNGDYCIVSTTGALFGPKAAGLWPTTAIELTSAADAANTAAINTEIATRIAGDGANAAAIANNFSPAGFAAFFVAMMQSLPTVPTSPIWNNNGTPQLA